MYRFKSEPQNLPELFIDALNLFGHGLKEVWIWALVAAAVGILSPRFVIEGYEMMGGKVMWSYNWLMFTLIITGSMPAAFVIGMMTRRLFLLGADREEPIKDSLLLVLRKFPHYYLGLVLVSAITIIGWLLIYIPGVFFSIVFVFTMPLILLDDYSIFHALKESWHLVVGNWWRIFMMFLFPIMVFIVTAMMPHKRGMESVNMVMQGLVMWFAMPMMLSFMLTIFYDTKLRHNVPLHLKEDKKKPRRKSKKTEDDSGAKVTAASKTTKARKPRRASKEKTTRRSTRSKAKVVKSSKSKGSKTTKK